MSVHDRFPHSTCELQSVRAVQFGVLSPDEIVRDAARGISRRSRGGRAPPPPRDARD